jgi:hypothetical protein
VSGSPVVLAAGCRLPAAGGSDKITADDVSRRNNLHKLDNLDINIDFFVHFIFQFDE